MEVCNAYKKARTEWLQRYEGLNRRYEEAEKAENWRLVESLGEQILWMEERSGFRKCLNCGKRGCPAHFDGFCSWEPMDGKCRTIQL